MTLAPTKSARPTELPAWLVEAMNTWHDDPAAFFDGGLGFDGIGHPELWDKQREICASVVEFYETHVPSATGVGKTELGAGLVPWWLVTHPNSIVVTTANTWNQVEVVLWSRIRRLLRAAPLDFGLRLNNTEIRIPGEDEWYAIGLSTNEPERFAGFHAPGGVLVLVEEAVGLEQKIWDAIYGILVGRYDRLVAIGNPITKQTAWHKIVETARRSDDGNVIHISAFDSPNVKTGREIIPGLRTRESVERDRKRWGEDDPRWYARVLGLFPPTEMAGLYPLTWLERAFEYIGPRKPGQKIGALDVARYGGDDNAYAQRDGIHLTGLWTWGSMSTVLTRKRAVRVLDGYTPEVKHGDPDSINEYGAGDIPLPGGKPTTFRVDADGLGGAVYDEIEEQGKKTFGRQEVVLEEWHAGGKSPDPEAFEMFKDCAYWQFRVRLERGEVDLSALTEEQRDEIETEALAIGWHPNKRGAKVVDTKEIVRREIKRSPDPLEAIVYGFYEEAPFDVDADDALSGQDLRRSGDEALQFADAYQRYQAGLEDDPPVLEEVEDVYDPMVDILAEDGPGAW